MSWLDWLCIGIIAFALLTWSLLVVAARADRRYDASELRRRLDNADRLAFQVDVSKIPPEAYTDIILHLDRAYEAGAGQRAPSVVAHSVESGPEGVYPDGFQSRYLEGPFLIDMGMARHAITKADATTIAEADFRRHLREKGNDDE